jgi:hypothetical protein
MPYRFPPGTRARARRSCEAEFTNPIAVSADDAGWVPDLILQLEDL